MISSSDFVLKSSPAGGSTIQKILQIQQEIDLIGMHEREHVKATGEILRLDNSCPYCKRHSTDDEGQTVDIHEKKNIAATLNELQRTAEASGKNAYVLVPRSWAGKTVKIALVEG